MSTITIRCPDGTLGELLRKESRKRGESIKKLSFRVWRTDLPVQAATDASAMEQSAILLSADAHFTWIDGLLLNIPL
jgi:hypothetical protein